jgi:hypothetical protein
MTAAIGERKEQEFQAHGLIVEWQTRVLASFIASTIQVAKKDRGKIEKMLDSVHLFSDGALAKTSKPKREPTPEEIVSGQAFEGRVAEGAYERFMAQFGRAMDKG